MNNCLSLQCISLFFFFLFLWESVEQKGLYFYFAFSKCQGQQQGFDYRGNEKAHREVSEMTYSPSILLHTAFPLLLLQYHIYLITEQQNTHRYGLHIHSIYNLILI
jgi:hypothetical protein